MAKYIKRTEVEAVQFLPTKEQKATLAKKEGQEYSPAVIMGATLKKRSDGTHYINPIFNGTHLEVEETDWLVTEQGVSYVLSSDAFKSFEEVKEEAPKEKAKSKKEEATKE